MHKQDLDALMDKVKKNLDSFPPRDPNAISEGKARFLAQAKMIQRSPVTLTSIDRHSKWKPINLREVKMSTLATMIVVIGLIFGGLTGTVAAALDDLPGQALYQVKLFAENAQLRFTQDPMKRLDVELQFAQRRIDEIKDLQAEGIEPPYLSYARFENHLQLAIGQTKKIDPKELPGALLRIREMLRDCLDNLDTTIDEPLQTRLRTMLQDRISWLDDCIENPDRDQNQVREGWDATPSFGEENLNKEMNQEQNQNREQIKDYPTEKPGIGPGYTTPKPDQPTPQPDNQTPGSGYQTPGAGYQTPGPGYQTPGPGYQTPGPGDSTPEPGYQTPGPGYQTPGSGNETPGPGSGGDAGKKP